MKKNLHTLLLILILVYKKSPFFIELEAGMRIFTEKGSFMITKEQALTENNFHMEPFPSTLKCKNWRRNGKTQTWKTRLNDFKVPIKHGLYDYAYIDQNNAQIFHLASECINEKQQ